MTDWLKKLIDLEKSLSRERGHFRLFALLQREEAAGRWDLVVSAAWLSSGSAESLRLVTGRVSDTLSNDEVVFLSRVVIVDDDHPGLAALEELVQVEHGCVELSQRVLFGHDVQRAYVITSGQADGQSGVSEPAGRAD